MKPYIWKPLVVLAILTGFFLLFSAKYNSEIALEALVTTSLTIVGFFMLVGITWISNKGVISKKFNIRLTGNTVFYIACVLTLGYFLNVARANKNYIKYHPSDKEKPL